MAIMAIARGDERGDRPDRVEPVPRGQRLGDHRTGAVEPPRARGGQEAGAEVGEHAEP